MVALLLTPDILSQNSAMLVDKASQASCLDLINAIHLVHYSVQRNNFYLRLHGERSALNKQTYSQYSSCYVNTTENLDDTRPGYRELIHDKRLSVQCQEK